MIRILLVAVVSASLLGACVSINNNPDYGSFRHADGAGPSFNSRILP